MMIIDWTEIFEHSAQNAFRFRGIMNANIYITSEYSKFALKHKYISVTYFPFSRLYVAFYLFAYAGNAVYCRTRQDYRYMCRADAKAITQ